MSSFRDDPHFWRPVPGNESDIDRVWERIDVTGTPTGETEVEYFDVPNNLLAPTPTPVMPEPAAAVPIVHQHIHHHHHWIVASIAAVAGAGIVELVHLLG